MGQYKVIFPAVVVLSLFLYSNSSSANPPLDVSGKLEGVSLMPYMEMLEDQDKELTIDDLTTGRHSELFDGKKWRKPNLGYTSSAIWVRFSVENRLEKDADWLLELAYPFYSRIELYIPDGSGGFNVIKTGNDMPFGTRDVRNNNYVFNMKESPLSERTYYLRVESELELIMALKAWLNGPFGENVQRRNILLGSYFGMIFVMMLFNLFIYTTVRDKSYLYYVIYLSGMLLTQLSYTGISFQYIWPDSYDWNTRSIMVFTSFSIVWGVIFSRSFLNTSKNVPGLDKILKLIIAVAASCFLLSFFISPARMGTILNTVLVGLFFLLAAGIISWRKGYRPARYYNIAWTVFLAGLILLGLRNHGILDVNPLTSSSYLVGSAMEVILLSIALGDRINIMRQEKEEAQMALLGKERLVQETLREVKEELEDKVTQRTLQLVVAKDKAENATKMKDKFVSLVSHDLRSPLALIRVLLKKGMKEMEGHIKPSAEETLTDSIEVINEMENFIDSLLKVERFQTGLLTIEKIPINIFELVEKLKTEMSAEARNKEQEIINEIPKDMVVNADEILLLGVFRNLLMNAIKFSYRGGTISIYSPDDGIECAAVADTGVGIPEITLKTIFDYGVKKSTRGTDGETGYGLGLQLCRDIIEAHGGKIEVTSTVGKGSVFQLRLPSEKGNELLGSGSEKEDAIETV